MLDLDDISFKMVKEYACMAMGFHILLDWRAREIFLTNPFARPAPV